MAPDDDEPTGFRAGSTIRFSSDDTIDVPLWDDGTGGLLFNDGEELVSLGGISQELADEVVAWGRASQGPATPELHAEAARLILRLKDELNSEVRFVYQP